MTGNMNMHKIKKMKTLKINAKIYKKWYRSNGG